MSLILFQSYLNQTINYIIIIIFDVFKYALIIRAVISWLSKNPFHPFIRYINFITEPIIVPFRRVIPPMGFLDLSFIIAFFAVDFMRTLVIMLL